MTRQEKRDAALAILITAIMGALLWWSIYDEHRQTVPSAVLSDSMSLRVRQTQQVQVWVLSETDHLAKAFDLPTATIAVVDSMTADAWLIAGAKPTRYALVVDYTRDEGAARKRTAHEVGHMLLAECGLPQSERTADLFAFCFGSEKARYYAHDDYLTRYGSEPTDCDQLAKQLGRL